MLLCSVLLYSVFWFASLYYIVLSFTYEFWCRGLYNVVLYCVVYMLLSFYTYYLAMYYSVFNILIYCVVMYYTILYSILFYSILFYSILLWFLCCYVLYYVILSFPVLHYNVSFDQHLYSSVVVLYLRNTATSPLILCDRSLYITVNNTTSAMTPPSPTSEALPHRFFLFLHPHRHTTPFPVYNTRHHIDSQLATIP